MNNGRIRKLDELVVNRIAAGEIIHRPANAIKEMLENSLDAGATNIKITIKDGGLKLLQIQDNGGGISKEDLPILCERFTTSKIRKFEDLQTVSTFGFRGEALASISHVAHLSILTKKVDDNAGWKANYSDGKQIGEAKPTAGNKGTIISVEDLFFNVPMRRRALKSANEEYNKIVDVVTKYAVHNPTVSFVCKKVNANVPEISTLSRSTTVMNIKALFGPQVSKELLRFESEDQELDYKCSGYATSTNYASKRTTMLLFINHRLVDCPPLKKSLENAYSALLPKGSHPFVYVDLEIPPQNIDVNVHPTKSQVHFINEDEIIEHLVDALSVKLSSSNTSKSYDVQTYLPKPMPIAQISNPKFIATFAKPAPKAQVRTDGTTRTLDSFIPITQKSSSPPASKASASTSRITSTPLKRPAEETPPQHTPASTQSMRTPIEKVKSNKNNLTSVRNLRQAVIDNKNEDVTRMIKNHTFVGFVDMSRHLALIQHNTQLIMLDYKFFAYELFYQIALNQFGNMAKFELNPPPNIRILIEIALKAEEEDILESGGEVPLILEKIVNLLTSKAGMLDEYFSITINESGELERLPLLLKDYVPDINAIPTLLMNLGPLVNWEDEQECFDQILKQLALFYTPSKEDSEAVKWQIQHVLFQSMVKNLTPSDSLNAITEVTSLQNLYRIFERC